jgi:predicted secreted protein
MTPRRLILAGALVVALAPTRVTAGTLDASWIAPTTNTDGSPLTNLAGYRVYYGTNSAQLTPCQNATLVQAVTAASPTPPPNTTVKVALNNLTTGTVYYASITSVNAAGKESVCSPLSSAPARADGTGPPSDPGTPQLGAPVLGPTTVTYPMTFAPSVDPSGGPVTYTYSGGYNDGTATFTGASTPPAFPLQMPYHSSAGPSGAWTCVRALGPPPGLVPSVGSSCLGYVVPAKPVVVIPPAPTVVSTTTACTITLQVQAPDATAGWQAQFKMDNGLTFGVVDSTPPYTQANTTVTPGIHTYYVEWLKGGVLQVTSQKATRACP